MCRRRIKTIWGAVALGVLVVGNARGQSALPGRPGANLPAAPAQSRLTIGSIFPLSGVQAAYGQEAGRGIELAMAQLKIKAPELAARLEVVIGDDLSTAKDAAAATDKLIEHDRVQILIGSVASGSTAAMAGQVRHHELPMIAPITAQSTVAMGNGVFRSCVGEDLEGAILAELALKVLGVKQVATLRDEAGAAQAFIDRFAEAFKAGGGQVTDQETYDLAADDFTPLLKRIDASGAKLIVTPAPLPTAAVLMQQAKKVNPDLHFLGGDSWDSPALSRAAGPAAAGHFFVAHFATDDPDPAVVDFVRAFQQKYGRSPGAIAALTYDGFNLIIDAFRRANTNLKAPLILAVEQTKDLAGVTGILTLAGRGGEALKTGIVKETTADGAKFKARVTPTAPTLTAKVPPTKGP